VLRRKDSRPLFPVFVINAPELKALRDEMTRAQRRSDHTEYQRLMKQQSELQFQLRLRALERIRDGGDGPVDRELADRYVAIQVAEQKEQAAHKASARSNQTVVSQPASGPAVVGPGRGAAVDEEEDYTETEQIMQQIFQRQRAELGPLMGQLPILPEGPPSSSVNMNCIHRYGYIQLAPPKKLVVTVTFEDVSVGSRALVKWLEARGYRDLKYDLKQNQQLEDDEGE